MVQMRDGKTAFGVASDQTAALASKESRGADCGARTHDLGINEVISANAQEALVALASGDPSKAAAILAHLAQWGGQ